MAIDGGLGALFKQNLEPRGFHLQRIETGGTGRGICDTNYAAPGGVEGWIEYKQTKGWTVTLRPEQIGWIARRSRLGCRVFFAVRQQAPAGNRREKRDGLWLAQGVWASRLAQDGLRFAEELSGTGQGVWHWPGSPGAWSWDQIEQILKV